VNGTAWFGSNILPIHGLAFIGLVLATLFILIPLMAIRATRPYAAVTVYTLTFIFGGLTWFYAAHYCRAALGVFWLIVGLFFAGVGVIPVALVGSGLIGDWVNFFWFVFMLAITYGCRLLSLCAFGQHSEQAPPRELSSTDAGP
jgi:hypothetical protein